MTERARVLAWRLAILLVLVAAWEWLTGIKAIARTPGLYWIDPFFISRPSAIARRFAYLASGNARLTLWQMALSTIQSTLWGFLVGVSTGFAAGLVLGRHERLARIFDPYIVAFNSLPRIALVPLITMIFGFGLLAKIVLAWTIVFFIVFFNTFQGARSVDADLIHSARFLGGSDRQIMRTVIVPSALAWTFAALTPSISFALIGVVVGEFLGGESGGGLGYLIIQSLGTLNAADMMVALISLGVIGIVMALGPDRRLSHRDWKETMILALQLSHFSAAVIFAFFASIVFGVTQRSTSREMLRYTGYCFMVFVVGMWLAAWVLWSFAGGLAARYGALDRYDGSLFAALAAMGGVWQYRVQVRQGRDRGLTIFVAAQLLWLSIVLVQNGALNR